MEALGLDDGYAHVKHTPAVTKPLVKEEQTGIMKVLLKIWVWMMGLHETYSSSQNKAFFTLNAVHVLELPIMQSILELPKL